ncbi:uncharacterized protein TNCV_5098751 [Trichonephila clavipes]|uniref:Protein kinase domain-containing protein n=1 Tax=Trichonephila clavipes TaxID=2585209 RepID=A0A8X6V7C1_TRICX|nr:uncharacterized protein TNCV_5098751 [Trichonephila clavipes]
MVVQDSLRTDLVSSPLKNDKKHRLKQRFDVQRKLGQGTYGKVQLAINRETGQELNSVAQQPMRAKAHCTHLSFHDLGTEVYEHVFWSGGQNDVKPPCV